MDPLNPVLNKAQDFIWQYARLIDRRLFACLFLDGSREMVLPALQAYQNPDGGFGNALEPDKRVPHSQPVDAEMALKILDLSDGFGAAVDLVQRLCAYLASISRPEGGVPFAVPPVNDYPHAPWWQTPADAPASLNPTAAITGMLLKHGVQHPWVERASAFCWQAIAASDSLEFHDLFPMITFLEYAPERERAAQELERIAARIQQHNLVALDPQAAGYVHKPLEWAPTPHSYCRRLFTDETIQQHLDWLAKEQQPDGGWPISWQPVSPAVEYEWRGWRTVLAMHTLQAYGRL